MICACGREAMDGVRCKLGATHQPLLRMPWASKPEPEKPEPKQERMPWESFEN